MYLSQLHKRITREFIEQEKFRLAVLDAIKPIPIEEMPEEYKDGRDILVYAQELYAPKEVRLKPLITVAKWNKKIGGICVCINRIPTHFYPILDLLEKPEEAE